MKLWEKGAIALALQGRSSGTAGIWFENKDSKSPYNALAMQGAVKGRHMGIIRAGRGAAVDWRWTRSLKSL